MGNIHNRRAPAQSCDFGNMTGHRSSMPIEQLSYTVSKPEFCFKLRTFNNFFNRGTCVELDQRLGEFWMASPVTSGLPVRLRAASLSDSVLYFAISNRIRSTGALAGPENLNITERASDAVTSRARAPAAGHHSVMIMIVLLSGGAVPSVRSAHWHSYI
jgi:hypothetical protein